MSITVERVDHLVVQVYETREDLGKAAATQVSAKIKELLEEQDTIRMIFAAAPSQNELFETLKKDSEIDWSRIVAFHMDEYIGLEAGAPQSFGVFLKEKLFDEVKPGIVHYMDSSQDVAEELLRYGNLIKEEEIDIVCLGIGENGHLAFNDPPVADFNDPELIKVVELDDVCRQQQVNDGCFATIEDVPTHAITLTIPALMSGKHLFCIVPGPTKRQAVRGVLEGPLSTDNPATILRRHPSCILYLDKESYSK
ncbi:glucosamine-6-phosphate deaminase [Lederbergia wuyishanensis]|uniref:Glucosamine-6-phosphate deaminase n=1 Tax=Lederbergia wuyishanensis TaxID=1347903 RepID=A0ABU0D9V4_9BACI|nr:glucosamine-6-phosphate deaminase [Lederbergia wuyishanensis]MCJ8007446.1 glucosamine-6-phosphate deaminase [Lederbergia wuyishanensis]MDQ0345116.1 glucosamine-6-phosphate deaminase [Lederbergia wuyishanensis]